MRHFKDNKMQQDTAVPQDWYRHFFTAPVNRFWESVVPPEATEADIGFVRRHIGASPPARLLDIPCGAGRHSLGLARLGYRVTGVDISADAVERASATARSEGLPATFELGDMRSFEPDGSFDGAVCFGNSISYFDPAAMLSFFQMLSAAIRSNGRLLLDTYTCAESILPLREDSDMEFEGGSYRSNYRYDPVRSMLETRAELTLGDEVHPLLYAHQIVTSGELVRMVESAGFRMDGLFADVDEAPYSPGSPRLLLAATRL
jgi:SAM-dependent methyltransferase